MLKGIKINKESNIYRLIKWLLILLGIGASYYYGQYYTQLALQGKDARLRPSEGEVKLKVVSIDDDYRDEDNYHWLERLYSTSIEFVSSKDFQQIESFDDYVAYAKSKELAYEPTYFYLENPLEPKSESFVPIAYDASAIHITGQFINDISKKYEIYGIAEEEVSSKHLLLVGHQAAFAFYPFHPDLKVRRVTLKYDGKTITTPFWMSDSVKESDIDYIHMSKENAESLINGKIQVERADLEISLFTYKNHGLGFVTWNGNVQEFYNGYVYDTLGTEYVAFTKEATKSPILSTLYIAIRDEETNEEKLFSKDYISSQENSNIPELMQLLSGNWNENKE